MTPTPLRTMLLGMVLRVLLGRLTREPSPAVASRRRGRRPRDAAMPVPGAPSAPVVGAVRRRPLTLVMLACLGVGVPLMVLFESAPTRIIGVLSLFAFIVSGVFLIADPSALGRDEE